MVVGCLTDGINEVIATTLNNAAPMGIICKGNRHTMVVFLGSATATNIERDGWIVANIVHDPMLFVMTAFSDIPLSQLHSFDVGGIQMQRLLCADSWIAYTTTIQNKTKDKILVSLTVQEESIRPCVPRAVNRGFNSLVEATVHATRFVITKDPHLAQCIRYHGDMVKKCGSHKEKEAYSLLLEYLQRD